MSGRYDTRLACVLLVRCRQGSKSIAQAGPNSSRHFWLGKAIESVGTALSFAYLSP